jgi:hypothetical protein
VLQAADPASWMPCSSACMHPGVLRRLANDGTLTCDRGGAQPSVGGLSSIWH